MREPPNAAPSGSLTTAKRPPGMSIGGQHFLAAIRDHLVERLVDVLDAEADHPVPRHLVRHYVVHLHAAGDSFATGLELRVLGRLSAEVFFLPQLNSFLSNGSGLSNPIALAPAQTVAFAPIDYDPVSFAVCHRPWFAPTGSSMMAYLHSR